MQDAIRQLLAELGEDPGDHPRPIALAIALAAIEFGATHHVGRDAHGREQPRWH